MDPRRLYHHITHAKISTHTNFMDPCHPHHPHHFFDPRQNFTDPGHPRHRCHYFDPHLNFTDPRHPHQSLTHTTHTPMPPTLFSRLYIRQTNSFLRTCWQVGLAYAALSLGVTTQPITPVQ